MKKKINSNSTRNKSTRTDLRVLPINNYFKYCFNFRIIRNIIKLLK